MAKACRVCRLIIEEGGKCPNCESEDLSERWNSQIIVFDPEKSEMGKRLGAKVPGKYAVRIK